MLNERGDGQLRRLGDRRHVQAAVICPDCGRAGFHRAGCSRPDVQPQLPPTRPASPDELREIIRQTRQAAA